MELSLNSDRLPILSYLYDPQLPSRLIETFFVAAIEYADAAPWARLTPASHFPIHLDFHELSPRVRRLALILGGDYGGGNDAGGSDAGGNGAGGGDHALGLVLTEDLPEDNPDDPAVTGPVLSSPALSVVYAGYPDAGLMPILWQGQPLPRSRTGLLAWPTVHDVDDRVRAPRPAELMLLTAGLAAVSELLLSYPRASLDDADACPHQRRVEVRGLPGSTSVLARTLLIAH